MNEKQLSSNSPNKKNNLEKFEPIFTLGGIKFLSMIITHPLDRFAIQAQFNKKHHKVVISFKNLYKGFWLTVAPSIIKLLGYQAPIMYYCQQHELHPVTSGLCISSADVTITTPLNRARTLHILKPGYSISENCSSIFKHYKLSDIFKSLYKGTVVKLLADWMSWSIFFYTDNFLKKKYKEDQKKLIIYYIIAIACTELALAPAKNIITHMQSHDCPNKNKTHEVVKYIHRTGLGSFFKGYSLSLFSAILKIGCTSIILDIMSKRKTSFRTREQNRRTQCNQTSARK